MLLVTGTSVVRQQMMEEGKGLAVVTLRLLNLFYVWPV